MKYSKKTVEDAILICAIAASTPRDIKIPYYGTLVYDLSVPLEARDLALLAWGHAGGILGWLSFAHPDAVFVDAEAEALLRTGWRPA